MVKLNRINVLSLAKIVSAIQAVIGLVLGIVVSIGSTTNQQDDGIWSLGAWSLLVFPIVNAILGFLTGSLLALGYNLFAQWFGGIEFEIEKREDQ